MGGALAVGRAMRTNKGTSRSPQVVLLTLEWSSSLRDIFQHLYFSFHICVKIAIPMYCAQTTVHSCE